MVKKLLGTLARYGYKAGVHPVPKETNQYRDFRYMVVTDSETWGSSTRKEADELWKGLQESKLKRFEDFVAEGFIAPRKLGDFTKLGWKLGVHARPDQMDNGHMMYPDFNFFVVAPGESWGTVTKKEADALSKKLNEANYSRDEILKRRTPDVEKYLKQQFDTAFKKRNWKNLPTSFENDAVKFLVGQLLPHISKDDIKRRINVKKSTTFDDLLDALDFQDTNLNEGKVILWSGTLAAFEKFGEKITWFGTRVPSSGTKIDVALDADDDDGEHPNAPLQILNVDSGDAIGIIKSPKKLHEDAPAMAAGNGNVAGLGVGPQGEPGVHKKKRKGPDDKFAGADVFETDMDSVLKSRFGKNRYHRYSRYVGEDEKGEDIRVHGRTTKNDIVLRDSRTGAMTYLRRKKR